MNEYLNFPGKELNVPIIQSNNFFKKKQRNQSNFLSKRSEEVLLIFFRVFGNKFIILCDWFRCFFLKVYIYIYIYIYVYHEMNSTRRSG